MPPSTFPTIVKSLASIGANTANSRIVVEKPFGHSLDSAKALSAEIHTAFDEHQLFRIDHYLGKETVQNLVVFRFANSIWERVWNRDAVDHVQITVAESIGVEGRAGYYEHAGAIRDLLQNHMLQVMAFLAMEPPRSLEAEAFRDEKVKLLKAVRPIDPADVVRGQYDGYRKEDGVDPKSQTETFVAAKLWIDNWRWDGVPFYLRHGKELPERNTEIAVYFRQAPDVLFRELEIDHIPSNHLTIRVQPDEGISLAFQAKIPGPGYELQTVRMDFDYDRSFTNALAEAYERLLHDAMTGDHTLFTREDGVERAWEIVTPILEQPVAALLLQARIVGPGAVRRADRATRLAPAHTAGGGAPHVSESRGGAPTGWIDVSLPISPALLTWPGNPSVALLAEPAHRLGRRRERERAAPRHPLRHACRSTGALRRGREPASTACRSTC